VEGSCKEGEGRETYAKLSVTPVIKRDISVATAPSTPGTDKNLRIHGTHEVKDEKP